MTKNPIAYQGSEVLPHSCCDKFSPRQSITLVRWECWYCHYADFGLEKENALEVGFCRFPESQIKNHK